MKKIDFDSESVPLLNLHPCLMMRLEVKEGHLERSQMVLSLLVSLVGEHLGLGFLLVLLLADVCQVSSLLNLLKHFIRVM